MATGYPVELGQDASKRVSDQENGSIEPLNVGRTKFVGLDSQYGAIDNGLAWKAITKQGKVFIDTASQVACKDGIISDIDLNVVF